MHARGHNEGDLVWITVQAIDHQPDTVMSWEDEVLAPHLQQVLERTRVVDGVEYAWLSSDPTRIEYRMTSRNQAKRRVGEIADVVRRILAAAGL